METGTVAELTGKNSAVVAGSIFSCGGQGELRLYGGEGCCTGYWKAATGPGPGVDAFLLFGGCCDGLDDADLFPELLLRIPRGLSSLGLPISDLLQTKRVNA